MEAPLRKSSQFYTDLVEIVDYIASDNRDAALRFLDGVEETIELLRRMPQLGTKFPTKDDRFEELRRITVRRFRSYLVLYDLREDAVMLLRVVHGARDLDQLV